MYVRRPGKAKARGRRRYTLEEVSKNLKVSLTAIQRIILVDEQAIAIFHKAIRFEETSLRITMQHGSGVGTAGNEHMEIFLPELKFSKATPAIDKETGIEMTISFEGHYDNSSEQSAAQFTFKTAQATL